jgi:hypothetical protein
MLYLGRRLTRGRALVRILPGHKRSCSSEVIFGECRGRWLSNGYPAPGAQANSGPVQVTTDPWSGSDPDQPTPSEPPASSLQDCWEGRSDGGLFVRRYPPRLRVKAVRMVAEIVDIGGARGRPGRLMRLTRRRFGRLAPRSAACQGARHHPRLRSPRRGGAAPTGRRARPCRVRR